MSQLHFSESDLTRILCALDFLRDEIILGSKGSGVPVYLLEKIDSLRKRFELRVSGFTSGEMRNVCMGLELMLQENPMDFKTSQLFSRLCSICGYIPEK